MPLRVAFPEIPSRLWRGGFHYLLNLFEALSKYSPDVEPVLCAGASAAPNDLDEFRARFGPESVLLSEAFDRDRLKKSAWRNLLRSYDPEFFAACSLHRIDVVFENAIYLGRDCPIPVLAWFPDLQHRRLPKYFSKVAYLRREVGFRLQAGSRDVVVSSEDTKNDCIDFYPSLRGRIHVARFATPFESPASAAEVGLVLAKYDLPEDYFFLPNHFWVHKNHRMVIDMLEAGRIQGVEIVVALCGSPRDPRNPAHHETLLSRATTLGLIKSFRYLGEIPRSDMRALMTGALGVINPSFFEGWSTTVEEAKALEKRLILSDLPVHREQCGKDALYFDPNSATAFLDCIVRCANTPRNATPSVSLLRERQEARIKEYAESYATALRVTARHRSH